jgi:hypothetical protein
MDLIPSNEKGWVDEIHETGGDGQIVGKLWADRGQIVGEMPPDLAL